MAEHDQQLAERIEKTGLSDKASAIYAALLNTGGAYPSKIAALTKLNRTTIYKILENMVNLGLVSEIEKKNKLFYQAEHPRNLKRFSEQRINVANRQLETAESLLPTLIGLYSHAPNKPVVRFFEGKEGVLQVYQDHVSGKASYEMLAWSNTADLIKFLPENFIKQYVKKKERLEITARAILPDTQIDINYNKTVYRYVSKKIWPIVRNVSIKDFPFRSDITLYAGNKVSIINFSRGALAGTIIEDQTIHDMMTMIFEQAWRGVGLDSKTKNKSARTKY